MYTRPTCPSEGHDVRQFHVRYASLFQKPAVAHGKERWIVPSFSLDPSETFTPSTRARASVGPKSLAVSPSASSSEFKQLCNGKAPP